MIGDPRYGTVTVTGLPALDVPELREGVYCESEAGRRSEPPCPEQRWGRAIVALPTRGLGVPPSGFDAGKCSMGGAMSGIWRTLRFMRLWASNLVVFGLFFGILAGIAWGAGHLSESWDEGAQILALAAVLGVYLVVFPFLQALQELRDEVWFGDEPRQAQRVLRFLRLWMGNLWAASLFVAFVVGIAFGTDHLSESWDEGAKTLAVVAWLGFVVLLLSFWQAQKELREEVRLEEEIRQAEAEAEDDPRDDVFDDGIPDWAWRPKER